MRVLLVFIFTFIFISGQSLAYSCVDFCNHGNDVSSDSEKNQTTEASNHDCCDNMNVSEADKDGHECQSTHCLEPADYDGIVAVSKRDEQSSRSQLELDEVLASLLFLKLGSQSRALDQSPLWDLLTKVPLYITLQKLFLP